MRRHLSNRFLRLGACALTVGLSFTAPGCGGSPTASSDSETIGTSAQAMNVNDPNRDASWDWTNAATMVDLVLPTGATITAELPYFDEGSPAYSFFNVDSPDILPRDGWVLFLRDFGTPATLSATVRPASPVPFYMLYNKYRGILRLFYYQALQPSYTSVVGSLSFSTASTSHTALLTMQDVGNTGNSFASNYDSSRPINAVGATGQGWCMLDFNVLGFDPTTPSTVDPVLTLNLAAVTTNDIALSGNINLAQQMGAAQASKSPSGSGPCPTCNSIAGDFTEAGTIYTDTQSALKSLSTAASTTGSVLSGASSTISTIMSDVTNVAGWIPALAPIGSILKLIVGGGTANNTTVSPPPAPLIFHGDLTLNGTLTATAPWFDISFVLPGSQHQNPTAEAESNSLPLYDVPLGIFNLESQPQYTLYEYEDDVYTKCAPPGCLDGESLNIETTWTAQATTPLLPDVNFYVFDRVDSLDLGTTATIVPRGYLADTLSLTKDYRTANLTTRGYYYPCGPTICTFDATTDYVMSAQLHPRGAPATVTDVTVIRDYQVAPAYSYATSKPTTTSTGLHPRPSSLVAVSPAGLGLAWLDNDGSETGEILTEVFTPAGSTTATTAVIPLAAGTQAYSSKVMPVAPGLYKFTVASYEGSTSNASAPSNSVQFTVAPTVMSGGGGGNPIATH